MEAKNANIKNINKHFFTMRERLRGNERERARTHTHTPSHLRSLTAACCVRTMARKKLSDIFFSVEFLPSNRMVLLLYARLFYVSVVICCLHSPRTACKQRAGRDKARTILAIGVSLSPTRSIESQLKLRRRQN